MLIRHTVWTDSDVGAQQASVCLLNSAWEPLYEVVAEVGPFDDVDQVLLDLAATVASWVSLYGIAEPLPLT